MFQRTYERKWVYDMMINNIQFILTLFKVKEFNLAFSLDMRRTFKQFFYGKNYLFNEYIITQVTVS